MCGEEGHRRSIITGVGSGWSQGRDRTGGWEEGFKEIHTKHSPSSVVIFVPWHPDVRRVVRRCAVGVWKMQHISCTPVRCPTPVMLPHSQIIGLDCELVETAVLTTASRDISLHVLQGDDASFLPCPHWFHGQRSPACHQRT